MTHGVDTSWGETMSRMSWVEDWLRPQARLAKSEGQLLWICFCPSFEKSAAAWIHQVKSDSHPVMNSFRFETLDSVLNPEIDQAAQTLMQAMTGARGWPVNLIVEPDTLKPIIGFAALEIQGRHTLLAQLSDAWQQDAKRLRSFAEMSYFKASSQDPLRFATDPGECLRSLDEAANFFLAPIAQSFSSETGSFGAAESHLLYPAAYLGLAEDAWSRDTAGAPNLGEVALSSLIRGTGFDALAPSFFRVSLARGADTAPERFLVKGLRENAEMLDTLVRVWRRSRSPFLYETAVGVLGTLVEDFITGHGSSQARMSSWIGAPYERLAFGAADLLPLDAGLRGVAQEFFDLRGDAKLPTLARSVDETAKARNMAPQETLLAVQSARKELSRLRTSAPLWEHGPTEVGAELRALEAIVFALSAFESVHLVTHALPKLVPLIRRALSAEARQAPAHARVMATRTGLKLEIFELFSGELAAGLDPELYEAMCAERVGWAQELKGEILALQFLDFTVDTGFLGTRYDLVDHLGASGMAEQLRVLGRAAKPLRGGSFAQAFEKGEAFIFEETLLALSRVKRLGLVAASLYAGARLFFGERDGALAAGRPLALDI